MEVFGLWVIGFSVLWRGLRAEVSSRSIFCFAYLSLLIWHVLFLLNVTDTITLYGEDVVLETLFYVALGAGVLYAVKAFVNFRNVNSVLDDLSERDMQRLLDQNGGCSRLLFLLSAGSLIFYFFYDPTILFTNMGERIVHEASALSAIGTMLGLLYASSLGVFGRVKSVSFWMIWIPLLWLIMILVGGRVVVYTAAGGFLTKWLKKTNDSSQVILKKLVGTAICGYVAGVLLRDIRGIGLTDIGEHILSGKYFNQLQWQSSESTIYVYFCHVVFWGWDKIALFPGQSIVRIIAFFSKIIGIKIIPDRVDGILDLTQMLWIHINYLGNNIASTVTYPGSIPPTFYGEGFLNGGVLGMVIFIIALGFFLTKLEMYLDRNRGHDEMYYVLYGILFTSILYIMRGTVYWGFTNFITCFVAWKIGVLIKNRFF